MGKERRESSGGPGPKGAQLGPGPAREEPGQRKGEEGTERGGAGAVEGRRGEAGPGGKDPPYPLHLSWLLGPGALQAQEVGTAA